MATQITFGPLSGIWTTSIESTFRHVNESIAILGGRGQFFSRGVEVPGLSLRGEIVESTLALSTTKARQLQELCDNSDYKFHYVQFAGQENIHDGFYVLDGEIRFDRTRGDYPRFPFQVSLRKVGVLSDTRLAVYWTAAAEVYAWGGVTLTAKRMVSLPNAVTDYGDTILETRSSTDGSNQIIEDPARANIVMKSSATISNWYLSECRVYDSITAGDTVESNWVRVFSPNHLFSGDTIIQNGLLRFKHDATLSPNVSIWDGSAWQDVGQLSVAGSSNALLQITKISSEEIQWSLIDATTVIQYLKFSLRRGSYFCRVTVTAGNNFAGTQIGLSKSGAGYFAQLFNASANGAGGAGSLATDANNNYHCGYNTARNVVAGFVLLNKPANQPADTNADTLNESEAWVTGQVKTFFIIGWPQTTNPFVLATGRSNAAKVARECMYSVDQQLILVPKGFYS